MPCPCSLFQLREDVASCQPLATALDNGQVILCDRIADPWVGILALHGGPARAHGSTKAPQAPPETGGCPYPPRTAQPRGLSLQNAFWFSLGCCTFFLIPNIIFAVRLTKHFRPIRNRLM